MALQATEAPPDGIEGAARRLRDVAEARSGMPEELVALFVATMRAHGLLARSARQAALQVCRYSLHSLSAWSIQALALSI